MADSGSHNGNGKVATKAVRYLGQTYLIPLWLSPSTFVKRLRAGESFEKATKEPMNKSDVGRVGKNNSYQKHAYVRSYLIYVAKKQGNQGA